MVFPSYILSGQLMHYCIYLWSKQNPNTPRAIWGIQIQGFYVPFVLIALSLLMGSPITENIIGIVTAHVFYFFSHIFVCFKLSYVKFMLIQKQMS